MQCLEVRGAVRPIYGSLGVKRLTSYSPDSSVSGATSLIVTVGGDKASKYS